MPRICRSARVSLMQGRASLLVDARLLDVVFGKVVSILPRAAIASVPWACVGGHHSHELLAVATGPSSQEPQGFHL
eukprot:s2469_g2.t1